MDFSKENEIAQVKMRRPHVVILGAGASLAALPNGDKTGRQLPLMNNFVDVLHLSPLLRKAHLDFEGRNFEDVYNQLFKDASSFAQKVGSGHKMVSMT